MWNRFCDSFQGPEKAQLLNIERAIFVNIKGDVEQETGKKWCGDKDQNSRADIKVAQSVFMSFRSYERGAKYYGSFFNFKR